MRKILVCLLISLFTVALVAEEASWFQKIDISLGGTGIVQASIGTKGDTGDDKSYSVGSFSYDLNMTAPVGTGGSINTHLQAGQGAGLDNLFSTWSGVNGDADDDQTVRLTELWYEHAWSRLTLKAGKISLSGDFDTNSLANSETEQFLNGAFINNLALEFPTDNSASIIAIANLNEVMYCKVAVAQADADWNKSFANGLYIGELGYQAKINELDGNYRLYAWYNGQDREQIDEPEKQKSSNQGLGVSLDQNLPGDMSLFARWGMGDDKASTLKQSISAGVALSGKHFGRNDDAISLAIGTITPSDDELDNETVFEGYYSFYVNQQMKISPDIQYIVHPECQKDVDSIMVLGIRTQINF